MIRPIFRIPVCIDRWLAAAFVVAALASASGCATTEEAADESRLALRKGEMFVPRHDGVASVQLYRTGDEGSLALVPMESGETLTLAFDLVESDPRPLSVWFYHADRTWRRDLIPSEFLASFDHDDLFDYTSSRGSQLRYVHYRYAFPNQGIRFRMSGNYVVRVTEQGREEDVLFERPFFVSEQAMPVDFVIDQVMIAGSSFSALQPTVVFTPPAGQAVNAFDWSVCFVRNGQAMASRCSTRPSLGLTPALQYYLEPEDSFAPQPEDFFVDLSEVQVGPRVEEVDLSVTPFFVRLEPDYMRFPGSIGAPIQNGNPVIEAAVRSVTDPSVSADYMNALFSLVPLDERPVTGSVFILGSWNDWRPSESSRMTWNPVVGRYEATVLLKQGRYEYRYGYSDRATGRAVDANAPPRIDNVISAFVYHHDVHYSTDRLISALSVFSR